MSYVVTAGLQCAVLPASIEAYVPYFAGERPQARCLDRELAQLPVAERAEQLSGPLRPQNFGCSPLARPGALPLRERRELPSPVGTSGGPELARVVSQSHGSSAAPWLLSPAQAPVAARQKQAGL